MGSRLGVGDGWKRGVGGVGSRWVEESGWEALSCSFVIEGKG